tara:strand:+ start:437 stop:664 length:228 start_codon:yes stop_codon:yes gene_type:complete
MKKRLLLLIYLTVGCVSVDKIENDYDRGWIIESDGTRHFYGKVEVVLDREIRCLVHGVHEVVTLKKGLTQTSKNK